MDFDTKIFGRQKERENRKKMLGSFFTPESLAELVAKITLHGNDESKRVYDPTCGSGSLLLKFTEYSGAKVYGQDVEQDAINDIMVNIHDGVFECADTLSNPKFGGMLFDTIVSNPPYSCAWDRDGLANDERFGGILAPKSKSDLAFLQHSLSYLSDTGTATFVCFPGVLYRSGAEQKIRSDFIERNVIDTVIQLPENMFIDTSIATVMLVLKKDKPQNRTLFIDASRLCKKQGKTNVFLPEHLSKIIDIYTSKTDVKYISKLVDNRVIASNDCTLSVSQYVEQEDTREKIDIDELNRQVRLISKKNRATLDAWDVLVAELDRELRGVDTLVSNRQPYIGDLFSDDVDMVA